MISVIEAIAVYHNIRKSQYKSFSASPHTQLSFSLSQLLTLTRYLWVQSFNWTWRKIGAYSFASQPFTSRVMSTIIDHANLHPIGYIHQELSNGISQAPFGQCWWKFNLVHREVQRTTSGAGQVVIRILF